MDLKIKAIKELKEIIGRDYCISISDNEAHKLAISLLCITKISLRALTEANDKKSLPSVRAKNPQ